ncbi:DUF2125 domain-containing protein [Roseibium sp. M-1]
MPDNDTATGTETDIANGSKTKPSKPSRRRYGFLVAAIVLAIVGWSAAWAYGRSVLEEEINRQMIRLEAQGLKVTCTDLAIAGYPFRFEVRCDGLQSADRWGAGGSLGGIAAVALIYNPWHVILEAGSPASLTVPVNGIAGDLTWETARASVKFSSTALGTLVAVIEKPEAAFETEVSAGLFAAEKTELHLRAVPDAPETLEGFLTVEDLALKSLPELQQTISLRGHTRIEGGTALLAGTNLASLVFARGEVPIQLVLLETIVGDGRLVASGDLVLAGDGLLTGSLKLDIGNADKLLQTLKPLLPRDERTYSLLENIVKSLEPAATEVDGIKTITLPVAIDRGLVRVGFLPVGQIPPLFAAGI